ncbi:hypothetical protein ACS0TY_026001 [Phlomoides rotata]
MVTMSKFARGISNCCSPPPSGGDTEQCCTILMPVGATSLIQLITPNFTPAQLHETAVRIEASGQDFIWVVKGVKNQDENEDWLPKGFEERIKGRGWAPQLMILDHPAIGAFVTHCGWNSTLEGICAGVPMVTWPVFAQQFFNEKLVTQVLGTGVSVGNKKWQVVDSEGVGSEAVKRIMVGEGAAEMRSRAKYFKEGS